MVMMISGQKDSQHHVSKVVGNVSVELDISVTLNRAQISRMTFLRVNFKKEYFVNTCKIFKLQTHKYYVISQRVVQWRVCHKCHCYCITVFHIQRHIFFNKYFIYRR